MASINGPADAELEQVIKCLQRYEHDHVGSEATAYRENSASIWIRIIDDRFAKMNKFARHDDAWKYLEPLPIDILEQIVVFLLLARSELSASPANSHFEHTATSAT